MPGECFTPGRMAHVYLQSYCFNIDRSQGVRNVFQSPGPYSAPGSTTFDNTSW